MAAKRKRCNEDDGDLLTTFQRASCSFSFSSQDSPFNSGSFTNNDKFNVAPLEELLSCGAYESVGKQQRMEDRHEVVPFTPIQIRKSPPADQKKEQLESTETPATIQNDEEKVSPTPAEQSSCKYAFFGVYDGHGGTQAAEYAQKFVHKNLTSNPHFITDPEKALREAIFKTEHDFLQLVEEQRLDGLIGTTLCNALIYENTLYVANSGDSGAVLYIDHGKGDNKIIELVPRHSIDNPQEVARIEKCGGVIHGRRLGHPVWNPNLINIGVTRALGDAYFKSKQWTKEKQSGLIVEVIICNSCNDTSQPEISKTLITSDVQFLVLGTDGLWDVISPKETVDFVLKYRDKQPSWICEQLIHVVLKKSAKPDNITVVLVIFQPFSEQQTQQSHSPSHHKSASAESDTISHSNG